MENNGENSVKVVFTYDVSVDNQKDYLKVTSERIRPFGESHNCQSYSVWQFTDDPTAFVKEMVFEDLGAMGKSMTRQEVKSVKDLFHSFANDVSGKVYIQRI